MSTQTSRGSVGHSKHRKAFVHGAPGESSKGRYGPRSWWQKFLLAKEANRARLKPAKAKMYASIRDLFGATPAREGKE